MLLVACVVNCVVCVPSLQQAADESGDLSSPTRGGRISSAVRQSYTQHAGSPQHNAGAAVYSPDRSGNQDQQGSKAAGSDRGPLSPVRPPSSMSGMQGQGPPFLLSPGGSSGADGADIGSAQPWHSPAAPDGQLQRVPSARRTVGRPVSGLPGSAQPPPGSFQAAATNPSWAQRIASGNRGIQGALEVSAAVNTTRPQGAPPGGSRMVQSARPFLRDGPAIDPSV
jgi:hypothetical protein